MNSRIFNTDTFLIIIHEIDKSLEKSQRRHKRQYKLDALYVFVKKLKIKTE